MMSRIQFLILILLVFCNCTTSPFRIGTNPLSFIEIDDFQNEEPVKTYDERYVRLINLYKEKEGEEGQEDLLNTIKNNIRRWQAVKLPIGKDFLEVNIPDYTLRLFKSDGSEEKFRVIVGKRTCQTPLLSSEIQSIELNPYWNVPDSIAQYEIFPQIKKDPEYLKKSHMELVEKDGRKAIRQIPGPWNAVGPIKFIFKNNYEIYLHGTPNQKLFEEHDRCLSHGCIRVENPLELAIFAMRNTEWTPEKLSVALASGKTRVLKLPVPLPIFINYWTVTFGDNGLYNQEDDIYDLDRER